MSEGEIEKEVYKCLYEIELFFMEEWIKVL